MNNLLSAGQLKLIKTLVGKLKVADPQVVVLGFTDMRTEHVSEMTMVEATAMIKHLKGLDPDTVKCEKMRRKLIGMAYTYYGLGRTASLGEKKAVQAKVKKWVVKYGHGGADRTHKVLDDYGVKDLPKLISQFGKVTREFLEKI